MALIVISGTPPRARVIGQFCLEKATFSSNSACVAPGTTALVSSSIFVIAGPPPISPSVTVALVSKPGKSDPLRAPTAKLPRIEDAVKSGGFLTGSADEIIDHLKKLEKAYPGLDRISISPSLGVPEAVILEQVERFSKEVMPAFKGKVEVKETALAK